MCMCLCEIEFVIERVSKSVCGFVCARLFTLLSVCLCSVYLFVFVLSFSVCLCLCFRVCVCECVFV